MNRTMAERCLQIRLQGGARNMGPSVTSVPVPLMTPQCCTHRLSVKCVQANACPCQTANRPCMSSCPSENCRNRGSTWGPTAPRLTTNVSETIEEAQEAAPIICQAINPVIFHQDAPSFLTSVLLRGDKWPALPARADTSHTAPALTMTAAPKPAAPAAVGSGKNNSNRAKPKDGQAASPSPPADQDSDGT